MASLTQQTHVESLDTRANGSGLAGDLPLGERPPHGAAERPDEYRLQSPLPHVFRQPIQAIVWLLQVAISVVSLVALLTVAASIPVLNLYAFGYLLESQGQVVRTGKLRRALPLLPTARKLGLIVLAITLFLLPVKFIAGATRDVWLLAPNRPVAWLWSALLAAVVSLTALHLLFALARGGGIGCFLRPIKNVRWLLARNQNHELRAVAFQGVLEMISALRVRHHVKLGLFGYVGTYLWLAVPTLLYTSLQDGSRWWQRASLLLGGAALALISIWVPFLQVQLAAEARPADMFGVRRVRERFRNAPFAWLVAIVVLLGLAVLPPLYQVRIKQQLPPHDVFWDVLLLVTVVTFPGRLLVAWAYHRGSQPRPIWRAWRWTNRLALITAAGLYVAFLMLAASGGELGQRVVWQHHAMLLPWPTAGASAPTFDLNGSPVTAREANPRTPLSQFPTATSLFAHSLICGALTVDGGRSRSGE